MLTLKELLADKAYREFFTTMPDMPPIRADIPPRWRLYVQRRSGGGWARKEFYTYKEAFQFLKPHINEWHNAAIQSKGIAFEPPVRVVKVVKKNPAGKKIPVVDEKGKQVFRRIVWQPVIPEGEVLHRWCPYCRRPTIFAWFSKHHAFPPGFDFDEAYTRCSICGVSERLLPNGY